MILEKIVRAKKEEVTRLAASREEIINACLAVQGNTCRDFIGALRRPHHRLGLIAEVKKASPSKGVIRPHFDPVEIAEVYQSGGADAISVLTDSPFFQGSTEYLRKIAEKVDIPVFRKDFLIDELQVVESRAIGADAILLIAAILQEQMLENLYRLARDLGMQTLIEVHDEEDLQRALALQPEVIGVNNRDLNTFHTSLAVTSHLSPQIPEGVTIVSESGISKPEDVEQLLSLGVDAVLVGEHFMRQQELRQAIPNLMGAKNADREKK